MKTKNKKLELKNKLSGIFQNTVELDNDVDWKSALINSFDFNDFENQINQMINEVDVIYYNNAIRYLFENDTSLQVSLRIASEYGYETEKLNSEILATLLKRNNLFEEWSEVKNQVEEAFDEFENALLNSEVEAA